MAVSGSRSTTLAPILAAVILSFCGCAESTAPDAGGAADTAWTTYEGAWFRILYPDGFTPRPSLPSTTAEGHDSVFFRSPDGSAEFYVCSPQWGRETPDIALDGVDETLVSEESVERGNEIARSWTIAARDGSYTRSYEELTNPEGTTRHVLGFRFADTAAYEKYLPMYTKFKKSLEQYAD